MFTSSVFAQSIFDVEIVFFKRINELHIKGQPEEIPLQVEQNLFTLSEEQSQLPDGYQILTRSEQKLEGVFRRLRTTSTMRPLLHVGWRQTLEDKADSPWLKFRLHDDPEQKGLLDFQGIIRFSRNQGLLVESQVIGYRRPSSAVASVDTTTSANRDAQPSIELPFKTTAETQNNRSETEGAEAETEQFSDVADNAINTNADKDSFNDNDSFEATNLQRPDELSGYFEMSETLKVKLGDLYYIDHPTMGMLIKVTPYQASPEEQKALK